MSNARLEELRQRFQDNPRRFFAPYANELRKSGDSAQAIEICRTHLGGQPGHVSGHIVLAQALHEAGEKDEARQAFTTALGLDPENLIALRSMGEIAYANGEFDVARHWYERLLDSDPRNAEVAQFIVDLGERPALSAESPAAVPVAPDIGMAGPMAPGDSTPEPDWQEPLVEGPVAFVTPEDSVEVRAAEVETPDAAPELDVAAMDAGAGGDLAAAPEPFAFADPGEANTPSARVESHLEIEDMDSFLSPPSSPVVASESESEPVEIEEPEFGVGMFSAPEEVASGAGIADVSTEDPGARMIDWVGSGAPEEEDQAEETEQVDAGAGFIEEPLAVDSTDTAVMESDAEAAPIMWSDAIDVSEPEAPLEPPHALFAEYGFDGSAASTGPSDVTPHGAAEDADATAASGWVADSPPEDEGPSMQEEGTPAGAPGDEWFTMEAPGEATIEDQAPAAETDGWFSTEAPADESVAASDDWFRQPTAPEPVAEATPAQDDLYLAPELIPVARAGDEALSPQDPVDAIAASEAEADPVEASHPTEVPDESTPEDVVPETFPAMVTEVTNPNLGHTPRFTATMAPEAPVPAPFVTETLAELYIQQGFHDEALAIYRQLAERDPGDDSLRRRIEALEVGESSRVVESSDDAASEIRVKSQSVRSFFSGFARRTPSAAAVEARLGRNPMKGGEDADSPPAGGGTEPPSGQPESSFAAAASALATLFAASRPAAADEGAANALAGAYSEAAPGGRPSRAADRELSLDHLFRDVPASGTGGVMLDQFYAPPPVDSSGQAARPDEGAGTPDEGEADIRQFTAWLEGLRKK